MMPQHNDVEIARHDSKRQELNGPLRQSMPEYPLYLTTA